MHAYKQKTTSLGAALYSAIFALSYRSGFATFGLYHLIWPVCSHEGWSNFFCSPGRSTSSVGDIRALSPELVGLYITLDCIVGSRGDSEPPIEHRTIKNCGDGQPNLGIGWTYRQRCRKLPITIRK